MGYGGEEYDGKAVEDVVAVRTNITMHEKQNDTSSRQYKDKRDRGQDLWITQRHRELGLYHGTQQQGNITKGCNNKNHNLNQMQKNWVKMKSYKASKS